MNLLRSSLPVLILCVVLGCSRTSMAQQPSAARSSLSSLGLSPELGLTGGKSIDAALAEPFDAAYDVTLSAPQKGAHKTLRTCIDYLAVEHSIYSAGSAMDFQSLRSDGARCDALDLLRSAKPAAHPLFSGFAWSRVALKDLPPGLALVISNEEKAKVDAITARHGSILDVDKNLSLHAKGSDKAEVVAKDWTATFTVYAHADFLGNGSEQLLLRRDAAATHGTYASTTIFLLSRPSPDGMLHVERERP